jgi:hypothetical protein
VTAPLDTHGRWPLVGATALVSVTALTTRRREWRPLCALLWHQTEEWVWPGGFLPWFNRELVGSDEDEFPLDRRLGFTINVGLGWGGSIETMLGPTAAAAAALLFVSQIGNFALHVSWAVRNRRYDPGTATAVAALLPVGVAGLRRLHADPAVSRRALGAGILGGAVLSAALRPALKWRMRRGR